MSKRRRIWKIVVEPPEGWPRQHEALWGHEETRASYDAALERAHRLRYLWPGVLVAVLEPQLLPPSHR